MINMAERVCENCRFYWDLRFACGIYQTKVHKKWSCMFWGGKE